MRGIFFKERGQEEMARQEVKCNDEKGREVVLQALQERGA
jgi:hypothetical protein